MFLKRSKVMAEPTTSRSSSISPSFSTHAKWRQVPVTTGTCRHFACVENDGLIDEDRDVVGSAITFDRFKNMDPSVRFFAADQDPLQRMLALGDASRNVIVLAGPDRL